MTPDPDPIRITCEFDRYGRMWIKRETDARQFEEIVRRREGLEIILGLEPEPPPDPVNGFLLCGLKPPTNPRSCPNEMCPYEILAKVRPFEDPPPFHDPLLPTRD